MVVVNGASGSTTNNSGKINFLTMSRHEAAYMAHEDYMRTLKSQERELFGTWSTTN